MARRLSVETVLIKTIDRALNVKSVEERDVDRFIASLEEVLGDARILAISDPEAAMDVFWHFISAIPAVFNVVHDETELGTFCKELAEGAIRVSCETTEWQRKTASVLIAVFAVDDYGRFDFVPDLLVKSLTGIDDRRWLSEAADATIPIALPYKLPALQALMT